MFLVKPYLLTVERSAWYQFVVLLCWTITPASAASVAVTRTLANVSPPRTGGVFTYPASLWPFVPV